MNTMIEKEYPGSELTAKTLGCAMEVYRILGNGFSQRDSSGTGSNRDD